MESLRQLQLLLHDMLIDLAFWIVPTGHERVRLARFIVSSFDEDLAAGRLKRYPKTHAAHGPKEAE